MACACLTALVSPSQAHEVGGRLDLGREPIAVGVDLDGQRRPAGQVPEGGAEAIVELGGSKPAGELAELVDGDGDLGDGVVEGAADLGIDGRSEGVLGVAECKADRHQPLLGAVVQVAFDPAPLVVGGGDDPGP